MTTRSLIPFLAITFGLAWASIGLLILFPDEIASVFGELSAKNPLFILAVYAPAIAAFTLVIRHGGRIDRQDEQRILGAQFPEDRRNFIGE